MPDPCCSSCYDTAFDGRLAERELREYRRKGPGRASRAIAEALARKGTEGRTVLDIGGGVGAVHQQLLARGATRVTDVDASRAYLEAARAEAERVGLADRVRFEYGDFVSIAPGIDAADLVALDRVVCCYGDVDALVGLAAARTRRRLAITIPPDAWPVRAIFAAGNAWYRLTRKEYRAYAHRHERVTAAALGAGLESDGPVRKVGLWRLLVFERPIRTAEA
ncbi:MAG: methyltransferase domain-containing protein [Chloroflexi bacterium]|nr:methyltransferase domain-containing protein [Chloroflexota bacterium]